MGIIAPEKKQKKTFPALLIFIFAAIAIPFFSIKFGTKTKSTSSPEKKSVESPVEKISTSAGNLIVNDTAGILTAQENADLTDFLTKLNAQTGVQIAVLTLNSLEGQSIETVSLNYAEKMQLGQKGIDNGALLTVSMEERAIRIETGYGTEGALTDAKCSRIIRNIIVPAFQKNQYGKGITEAVKNMAGIITEDETLISPQVSDSKNESNSPVAAFSVFGFIMMIIFILIITNRHGRIMFFPFFFGSSGNHHHNNFGGFGGGSGDGFSGGGGRFGGGGSSGHW